MSNTEPKAPSSGQPSLKNGAPPPPFLPDYRLLRKIGEGSYGQVWLAQGLAGTFRAVKLVYRQAEDGGRAFDREYQGIQNYEPISRMHECLVDILHVGRIDSEGFFYYVMELADPLKGIPISDTQITLETNVTSAIDPATYVPFSLQAYLNQHGHLDSQRCLQLGLALADALQRLHQQGLVHRDVKPSNIIFVGGIPKLTDIGLVARIDARKSLVGTIGYAPPEGMGSAQADLYGLGKVLYEASTGKNCSHFPEPATAIKSGEIDAWSELNEIILKACALEPRNRYASAQEMRDDLFRLQAGGSLRRLHEIERRMAIIKRAAWVVLMAAALAGSLFLFQVKQARQLVHLAAESQSRLQQLHVANGIRAMDEGQLAVSLVWFTEALKLTPPGAPEEDSQRHRWEAVWRQFPRLASLGAHRGPVNTAVLSPDETKVLSASEDKTARLFDLASGRTLLELPHAGAVKQAAFSRDGQRILTSCTDQSARVWDAVTGLLCLPPLRHDGRVFWAAFSPDSHRITTCGADGAARLWDGKTGELIGIPHQNGREVNYVEFSSDGRWLVTAADDSTARVFDALSGNPAGPPLNHGALVRQARFSPDGTRVATASQDKTARVWDAATGRPLTPSLAHNMPVWFVQFSPDGQRLVAGGGEDSLSGEARVWDAFTGAPVSPMRSFTSRVRNSAFDPDGRWVASACRDGSVRLWAADSGDAIGWTMHHNSAVYELAFAANGHRLLTCSKDNAWRLWDLAAGSLRDPLYRHFTALNEARFLPGGVQVLAVGHLRSAVIWNTASGQTIPLGDTALGSVTHAELSPDGQCLALVYDSGTIQLHAAATGRRLRSLSDCTNATVPCVISPNSELLFAAGKDNSLRIWRTATGDLACPPFSSIHPVKEAAFSPDCQVLATGGDCGASQTGELRLWSAATGQPCGPPIPLEGVPWPIHFSPDGRWLLTVCHDESIQPHALQLRDARTGQPAGPKFWHPQDIAYAQFSPDGARVATGGGDGRSRIWDAATGKPLTPWLMQHGPINYIAFSRNGNRLATASVDRTARVWDAATGEPLSPPLRHGHNVGMVSFDHQGENVLTASWDGLCRLWRLPYTTRPLHDLERLAWLQSGVRLDQTGGLVPLSALELQDLYQELRAEFPSEFALSETAETVGQASSLPQKFGPY